MIISISNTTKNLLQKVLFQLKFHKSYYCYCTCIVERLPIRLLRHVMIFNNINNRSIINYNLKTILK